MIALPSAIIAEGSVVFSPHLPVEVLQAHHDLPLGILQKIALRFKKNVFPSETTEFLQQKRDDGRGLNYLTRHWGSNVCIAFATGAARARAGSGRVRPRGIEHALDEFAAMLGSDVRKQFDKGAATAWASDPFARGAYSHCVPGKIRRARGADAPRRRAHRVRGRAHRAGSLRHAARRTSFRHPRRCRSAAPSRAGVTHGLRALRLPALGQWLQVPPGDEGARHPVRAQSR